MLHGMARESEMRQVCEIRAFKFMDREAVNAAAIDEFVQKQHTKSALQEVSTLSIAIK
jgi:hypothetical protein